jgi:hypothetical protein
MASIQALKNTEWSIPSFAQTNFDSAPTNRDWQELAELMKTNNIRSIKQLVRQFRMTSGDLNQKTVDYVDLQAQHHVYIEKCVDYDRQVDELRAENEITKGNARSVIDKNNCKLNEIQYKYDSLLGQIEVLKKTKELEKIRSSEKYETSPIKIPKSSPETKHNSYHRNIDPRKRLDKTETSIKTKHPNIKVSVENDNCIDLIDDCVRIDGRDLSITRNFISVETRKRKIQQTATKFKTTSEMRHQDKYKHRDSYQNKGEYRKNINRSFRDTRNSDKSQAQDGSDYRRYCND